MHNKLANQMFSANQSFFPFPTPFFGAGGNPASHSGVGTGMVGNDSITSRKLIKRK